MSTNNKLTAEQTAAYNFAVDMYVIRNAKKHGGIKANSYMAHCCQIIDLIVFILGNDLHHVNRVGNIPIKQMEIIVIHQMIDSPSIDLARSTLDAMNFIALV